MPEFTCPTCDTDNEVEYEDMPECACDDREWTCRHCGQKMTIGWHCEVEVRSVIESDV